MRHFILLFLFNYVSSSALFGSKNLNVFEVEGPIKIKGNDSHRNLLNVYCFIGKPMNTMHILNPINLLLIWKSVKFSIHISSENFQVYRGTTPADVANAFSEVSWIPSFISSGASKTFNVNPFNKSCLGVQSPEIYDVEFVVNDYDKVLISILCVGVFLLIYAKNLAENKLFYYLCGIIFGMVASVLILVYFLSKFLPGRPIFYTTAVGITMGVTVLNMIWSNFKHFLYLYYDYALWYVIVTGLISFFICYRIGPPKDKKSKNIISWILQACGIVCIYFSTNIFEYFCAITILIIIVKIFPRFIFTGIKKFWLKKFPPKQRLLTQEEYYIQGQLETSKALEELRGYCSSPECKQWKLMLTLKDPQRFADFIENKSHLSDSEIQQYESNDFVLRKRNLTKLKQQAVDDDDGLISDDDSSADSSSDEDEY